MRFSAFGIGATLAGAGVMFFLLGLRGGVGFLIGAFVCELVRQLRR